MSVGRMRRSRLYLTIRLCGVTARLGPPSHLTNREGFEEIRFLPGLLGITHGIAHGIAHEIADFLGTTGLVENTGIKGCETSAVNAVSRARYQRPKQGMSSDSRRSARYRGGKIGD